MATDLGLSETLVHDISTLVDSFSEKDPAGKQSLSQLLALDPRGFGTAALRVLTQCRPSPGYRYMVHLLTKEKLLPGCLLDLKSLGMGEAVETLRAIAASGTNLQPLLELALNRALLDQPSADCTARILRVLELLAAIAAASSWNAFQLELMAYPDKIVRSKAALLIGRSTKNAAWIGRRFMDRDVRVQASAVEALWEVDPAEARPLFLSASKSKDSRVAANAALGLYRISDLKAIPILLGFARQEDLTFRMSGLWAMGETQDPRFLPFLMEQFKLSQGKIRLAVTCALASIRRREKALGETGTLEIRVSEARAGRDRTRSIAFALESKGVFDFSAMKATDFAIWENSELIEEYEVKLPGNSLLLAAGFVVPRFASPDDPYARAVSAALERCSASKRPDDLWRIDRYSIEAAPSDSPQERTGLPYDDAIMTPDLKMRQYFIAAQDVLKMAISTEVPVDRTAPDSLRAIERQCAGVKRISAKRHVFVFLHRDSIAALDEEAHLNALKDIVTEERIALHGFAAGPSHDSAAFRDLCQSLPDGSFSEVSFDRLPEALDEIYHRLLNVCEILYKLPAGVETGPLSLRVSSSLGTGQAEIALKPVAVELSESK